MVSNSGKASPLKRLLQGCFALGLVVPGLAFAAQPQGDWKGLVQQANTDVAAQLRFRTEGVEIHFDEPFACTAPAKFLKEAGAASVYRFMVSQNGGKFCQDLQGRDLTFTPGADGRLTMSFPSAKVTWHGELRQANATSP
jgi:hypothetical protein